VENISSDRQQVRIFPGAEWVARMPPMACLFSPDHKGFNSQLPQGHGGGNAHRTRSYDNNILAQIYDSLSCIPGKRENQSIKAN
jgi:hypothetical protein